jgi:hypothetical protein
VPACAVEGEEQVTREQTTNPFATGTPDWQRYEDQLALQQRQKSSGEEQVTREQELLAEISRLRISVNKLSDTLYHVLGKELSADEVALFREVVAEARAIFQ